MIREVRDPTGPFYMSNYVSESHIIPDDFPQSNVDIRVELITEWILRGLETFHRTECTVTHAGEIVVCRSSKRCT